VDPENRLVAAELEREWNKALSKVCELGNEIALLDQENKIVSEKERQSILFKLRKPRPLDVVRERRLCRLGFWLDREEHGIFLRLVFCI
jgi:hypothetical protein